jgi:large-conductance mechanosensitive channel
MMRCKFVNLWKHKLGENNISYIVQIISGVIIALSTFLLTLLSFKIQQKWKDNKEKKKLEKKTFDQLIVILSEIKRALDRCKSLLKKHHEKTKSYSNLYL